MSSPNKLISYVANLKSSIVLFPSFIGHINSVNFLYIADHIIGKFRLCNGVSVGGFATLPTTVTCCSHVVGNKFIHVLESAAVIRFCITNWNVPCRKIERNMEYRYCSGKCSTPVLSKDCNLSMAIHIAVAV